MSKVTMEVIEDNILAVQYHHFSGTTLTVACITMQNGFTVTGEAACVNAADFDPELGEKLAFADAKSNMWKFLGFRLRDQNDQNDDEAVCDTDAYDTPEYMTRDEALHVMYHLTNIDLDCDGVFTKDIRAKQRVLLKQALDVLIDPPDVEGAQEDTRKEPTEAEDGATMYRIFFSPFEVVKVEADEV